MARGKALSLEDIRKRCKPYLEILNIAYDKKKGAIIEVRCPDGHVTYKRTSNLIKGCRICSEIKYSLSIEDILEISKDKNIHFLDKEYKGINFNHNLKCLKCGHLWKATFHSIHDHGTGCLICGGRAQKDVKYCQELAQKHGWKFLDNYYFSNRENHDWLCPNGHIKSNTLIDFKKMIEGGMFCRICDYDKKYKECHELARKQNGEFLSKNFMGSSIKMLWKCKNPEHSQFEAKYSHIKVGTWCPRCGNSKPSKGQLFIYNKVLELYPDALIDKKGYLITKNMELDIYIPSLKKAIEYNGYYHFVKQERKDSDIKKNKECKKVGIKLFTVIENDFNKNKEAGLNKIFDFLKNT